MKNPVLEEPRTVEAALMDVKEVKVGTVLPNKLWEKNARVLAEEVKRLRALIITK